MSAVLITSITAITLALIFHTIGVWAEHKAKTQFHRFILIVWGIWIIPYFHRDVYGNEVKHTVYSEFNISAIVAAKSDNGCIYRFAV